ncbi:hypothetical protein RJ55_02898 [Drechmeria coniospora]|nr:hypothetical protein RJ55_02898 [Drechmeria coniospora]
MVRLESGDADDDGAENAAKSTAAVVMDLNQVNASMYRYGGTDSRMMPRMARSNGSTANDSRLRCGAPRNERTIAQKVATVGDQRAGAETSRRPIAQPPSRHHTAVPNGDEERWAV